MTDKGTMMNAELHRMIYVSRAVIPVDNSFLEAIVAASNRNNPAAGISGRLLHGGGHFLQLLDGPPESLRATRKRIVRDPRHEILATIYLGPVEERLVDGWALACYASADLDALSASPSSASRFPISPALISSPAVALAIITRTIDHPTPSPIDIAAAP